MSGPRRVLLVIVIALVVVEQVWLLTPAIKSRIFPPAIDAAAAGREIAQEHGCFSCHGPEGLGGIRNPGSDAELIPALAGGEMMMWADSEEQLREWIVYGRPRDGEHELERTGFDAGQGSERAIVMPAFEPHIRAGEIELLMAYLKAISGLQFPEDKTVAKGLELAHELGCFRCHGPMGVGGVRNPGSLKGYVPGFSGDDFAELVADEEEAREWIVNGISERFSVNTAARAVLALQAIKMPAYGRFLSEQELDSLVALVAWLDGGQWREMPVP
jgi:mono/diheme cytochrome c family protein